MSNKNLLNESTIRKFMKLASIEPLASDFLGRIQESEEELEESTEELEESTEELEEDAAIAEMGDDAVYQDDEELDMELDMDAEPAAEEGAAGEMLSMADFMSVLEKALEDFLGEPAEVEYEDEEQMAADLDLEEPAEEPEALAAAAEEDEEEDEDLAESIYKEVLKRISKKK